MIITEKNPQKSLYFLGAKLLELLKEQNIKYTLFQLYQEFKKYQNLELKKFVLLLDWLFLIDSIKITQDGFIVKCF
ncbi:hypothetical protein BKH42_08840 [Helicobacter sp. 13S00482-2]|uniref:ABC-three component system middle component 6 n=1 Tax=Helicobacter sp. 13S00482-2 TaxID=1476200 RepID=UPI000BA7C92D|nr:ABC-three component system middle component 6 [Helicobacter sp. 13S00482-2]PAF52907.1 hypothetical protein BKH42_08840 [Helicobacter sp. 13S00482-2]